MRKLIGEGPVGRRAMARALLGGAACVFATGASAQIGAPGAPLRLRSDYFGYAASVSPRVSYSDNVRLAPDGLEESSVFLSTFFTGAAIYSTKRFTGVVNGDLDLSYSTDDSDFRVNQAIGAAGTMTVADNLAYIDIGGSTSRQLLGENARFSTNVNAGRNQRADVHSYMASPYFYHKFADESVSQLRYRFSQVFIGDERAAANPFLGDYLNDSRSHEVTASYDSGRAFERLHLTLTAYGARTIEDGSVVFPRSEYEQGSLMGEAQFALTSAFALSGAVGYDDIQTEMTPAFFDDAALSGVFWRAGFSAAPGRRTALRVEYGKRFDDDFIDASLTYRLSGRIIFTAGAGQTFRSRAQSIGEQYLDQERSLLDYADALRAGAELSPASVIGTANRFAARTLNGQITGVGVSKTARAQLFAAYERTEISAFAFYQNTDFGYRRDKSITGNLNARREISRRLAAYVGLSYRWADAEVDQAACVATPFIFGFDVNAPLFDPAAACLAFTAANGETNTLGGRIGAAYRLYRNLSAFAEFGRTTRWADSPLLEYDENNVVAGVTLDF